MKTRKKVSCLLIAIILLMSLVSCNQEGTSELKTISDEDFKVILLIPGNLGDKSFFDAANAGMKKVEELNGVSTRIVEMSQDETKWEPSILDAIDQNYDLIISGNAASDIMNDLAEKHPESRFLNFDNSGTDAPKNVYSVTYATNEGSFLAGAFAAMITSSNNLPEINSEKLIGFLGGMDIPGINDFLVGYIQGALYIDPEIKIATTYAGTFSDPAKGKELGLGMYNMGVDIAFNVAGQTGLGLIDAAYETKKYAIGVDSDQSLLYAETEPDKAEIVLTSVVKQIDNTIFEGVQRAIDGSLEYGKHELLGLEENAVALADNQIYSKVPEDIRLRIQEISSKIINNEIEVKSGFEMTSDQISEFRDTVTPR